MPLYPSGNLIKLDNNEIEIIQSAHHDVVEYNKNMNRLQEDAESQMEEEFNENLPNTTFLPNTGILEDYLEDYLRTIQRCHRWIQRAGRAAMV